MVCTHCWPQSWGSREATSVVGVKTAGKRRSLLMSDMACRGSGPAHTLCVAHMVCIRVSGYHALSATDAGGLDLHMHAKLRPSSATPYQDIMQCATHITHCTRLSCTVQGIMQCQPQMQLLSDSSCSCQKHQQTHSTLHCTLSFIDLECFVLGTGKQCKFQSVTAIQCHVTVVKGHHRCANSC